MIKSQRKKRHLKHIHIPSTLVKAQCIELHYTRIKDAEYII